ESSPSKTHERTDSSQRSIVQSMVSRQGSVPATQTSPTHRSTPLQKQPSSHCTSDAQGSPRVLSAWQRSPASVAPSSSPASGSAASNPVGGGRRGSPVVQPSTRRPSARSTRAEALHRPSSPNEVVPRS